MKMNSHSVEVILSLGSNTGCREESVTAAFKWLGTCLSGACWSGLYETDSISGDGRRYINAVVRGMTRISFDELERLTKRYELMSGRDETARSKGLVPVDIDIVIYNGRILRPKEIKYSYFLTGMNRLDSQS